MNKWIKFVSVDGMVMMGDEVDYATAGYVERIKNFKLDSGLECPACDDGWEGYTYEQGKGLFRWKNGGKEFISYEWSAGDILLQIYESAKAAKAAREKKEEDDMDANVTRDRAAAKQLDQDIATLKAEVAALKAGP